MKLSKRLEAERQYVMKVLGDSIICDTCAAKLGTYADQCSANLGTACPGFLAIEKATDAFNVAWIEKNQPGQDAIVRMGLRLKQLAGTKRAPSDPSVR